MQDREKFEFIQKFEFSFRIIYDLLQSPPKYIEEAKNPEYLPIISIHMNYIIHIRMYMYILTDRLHKATYI